MVQCVYADMRGNVLVHSKVPELGLHAVQWAVVSWAASQKKRENVYDAKYFYRYLLRLWDDLVEVPTQELLVLIVQWNAG